MSDTDPQRWQRVKEIFEGALERHGAERETFLDQMCDGEAEVREEAVKAGKAGRMLGAGAVLALYALGFLLLTCVYALQLAGDAESAGWDSVWVGDSIFAKPRLDAMVLMAAIAARTKRVRIGPACFASTPLRNALVLAYQWASLDFLSGGRTVFVACQGKPKPGGGDFEKEFAHFEIEPSSRMRRMEEVIEILRLTSSREKVDYEGQYWRFRNLTVLPRPVQQPVPIWVTANPDLKKRRNVEQS